MRGRRRPERPAGAGRRRPQWWDARVQRALRTADHAGGRSGTAWGPAAARDCDAPFGFCVARRRAARGPRGGGTRHSARFLAGAQGGSPQVRSRAHESKLRGPRAQEPPGTDRRGGHEMASGDFFACAVAHVIALRARVAPPLAMAASFRQVGRGAPSSSVMKGASCPRARVGAPARRPRSGVGRTGIASRVVSTRALALRWPGLRVRVAAGSPPLIDAVVASGSGGAVGGEGLLHEKVPVRDPATRCVSRERSSSRPAPAAGAAVGGGTSPVLWGSNTECGTDRAVLVGHWLAPPQRCPPTIPTRFETIVRVGRRERNAFGARTMRFDEGGSAGVGLPPGDNPGPGAYRAAAGPDWHSASESRRGLGNGFASRVRAGEGWRARGRSGERHREAGEGAAVQGRMP